MVEAVEVVEEAVVLAVEEADEDGAGCSKLSSGRGF